MKASIAYVSNPLNPAHGRKVKVVHKRHRISTLAPRTHLPFICVHNGTPLLRNEWGRQVNDGDIIAFVTLPQGSGGGGSNPLKVVMSIALSFAAPGIGGFLAEGLGIAGSSIFGIGVETLLGGAVSMVGNAVLNAVMPAPKPPSPNQSGSYNISNPSPTYNLNAQGNVARLSEPVPVLYGRHLIYPDFAATPFMEYAGNEQYIYQMFAIGMGEYSIESIRIEDTPISNFAEVTYQVYTPGQAVTLFPTNVVSSVEVSGQEMFTNTYIGGFVANPSGSRTTSLAVDIVAPRGLFYANDDGGLSQVGVSWVVEGRQVDDSGAALTGWSTLGSHSFSAATNTAQRLSYRYTVASARWEVRVKRTDTKNTNSRYGHEIDWAGLRAYLPDDRQYPCTILAVRMRATNNLSQTSARRINCIVTRKLPTWNGTTWSSPVATRSVAWALADILRADYGAKAPDSRIDLAQLLALETTLAARGDYFDGIFDSRVSTWEALTSVARVGRCKPYMQGGIVHFVRDQAQALPVALFTMRNIVRGTLRTNYVMTADETADCVIVEYFDSALWKPAEVKAQLPGSSADQPARIKLFGCTSRNAAWREGMYIAAANRYRRQLITFQTEMDGFIPTFADLIAISHDRPTWGTSGVIEAWNSGTKVATLSEPVEFGPGTNYIMLRKRDGSAEPAIAVTAGVDAYHVVLATAPSFTPYTGSGEEKTYFAFGAGEEYRRQARVVAVRPRSSELVEILCVNEDAAVHTADTGATPPDSAYWNLPSVITRPTVSGVNVTLGGSASAPLALVSWLPAASAESYRVEVTFDGGETWSRVADTTANHCSFPARRGGMTVRVAALGLAQGNWVLWTGNPYSAPPPNIQSFVVATQPDGTRQFSWVMPGAVPDIAGYKVRYKLGTGWTWENMTPLHDGILTVNPYETNQLAAGTYTFAIKAFDTSGNESETANYITAELADPRLNGVIYALIVNNAGWPGTKTNCHIEPETQTLGADDTQDWTYKTTWSGWTAWCQVPQTSITYQHSTIDLGAVVSFRPLLNATADGTQLIEIRTSNDGSTWSAWGTADVLVTCRYIDIRINVTGSYPRIYMLDIKLSGQSLTEEINDQNTASLTGSYRIGTGDIRLPITKNYAVISQLQIALQNVGAGWSWEVVDKNTTVGPRIKIYNSSNALADAVVDAYVRGF